MFYTISKRMCTGNPCSFDNCPQWLKHFYFPVNLSSQGGYPSVTFEVSDVFHGQECCSFKLYGISWGAIDPMNLLNILKQRGYFFYFHS